MSSAQVANINADTAIKKADLYSTPQRLIGGQMLKAAHTSKSMFDDVTGFIRDYQRDGAIPKAVRGFFMNSLLTNVRYPANICQQGKQQECTMSRFRRKMRRRGSRRYFSRNAVKTHKRNSNSTSHARRVPPLIMVCYHPITA